MMKKLKLLVKEIGLKYKKIFFERMGYYEN